jgi:hypothetical protein
VLRDSILQHCYIYKTESGVEVRLHTFDTLAIDYIKCCIFGERAVGTHWISGQPGWRLKK